MHAGKFHRPILNDDAVGLLAIKFGGDGGGGGLNSGWRCSSTCSVCESGCYLDITVAVQGAVIIDD